MPPVQKINVSVIVFDLLMERRKSLQILKEIIIHMNLVHKNDKTSLVLLHSKETSDSDHPNISVAFIDRTYGLDLCTMVEEAKIGENGNWLDALVVGANILGGYSDVKGVHTSQLIFITDMKQELTESKESSDLIDFIREKYIYLYVIGPDVQIPVCLSDKTDISKCVKAMDLEDNKSWNLLKEILVETEGIVCGADFGLDFLQYYVEVIEKQQWLEPLTFKGFPFPTKTSRIMDTQNLPKLNPIDRPRCRYYLEEDEEQEIAAGDVVKVYYFLDRIIAIPKICRESFAYRGPRHFTLIGFINSCDLPEVYLAGGEIHSVQVDPENYKYKAFVALVQATKKANKLGLALRSYNANNAPRLYVLIPLDNKFHMVPHAEVIKDDVDISEPSEKDYAKGDLVEQYRDNLRELSLNTRPLHPTLEAGPFHKLYVRNAVRIFVDGETNERPQEEANDNMNELEASPKVSVEKSEPEHKEAKVSSDEDDEW
ncbi:PREDICTED: uncharacterized protein LOC108557122 [Nicrophorus vespilloides]|uniref:Uncharacterized protein LOC108557122 n=1 Tax=Nicrophorus vespilloides TaxID=110193 RepID=A0ABM1M372_NICVS|nr:PREDICTED: uncharacterized protein LOC108557122 [Nicrophorus vespilloides]